MSDNKIPVYTRSQLYFLSDIWRLRADAGRRDYGDVQVNRIELCADELLKLVPQEQENMEMQFDQDRLRYLLRNLHVFIKEYDNEFCLFDTKKGERLTDYYINPRHAIDEAIRHESASSN